MSIENLPRSALTEITLFRTGRVAAFPITVGLCPKATVMGVLAPAAGVRTTLKKLLAKVTAPKVALLEHTATGFVVAYPLNVTVASCGSRSTVADTCVAE